MVRKIALITDYSEYAKYQCQQLQYLFKNNIKIKSYSYDIDTINNPIKADLFLTSYPSLYHKTIKNIPKKSKVLIFGTTITKYQYEQIRQIPSGTTCYVVNDNFISTMETITLFHDLGLDHLSYIPYYPGIENSPKLNIAITPGETSMVPNSVNQIIDIGHRIIDADTLTEIAIFLDLEHLLAEEHFVKHLQTLKIAKDSLISQFNKTKVLKSQFLSFLNAMDDGVIIIDKEGLILTFNEKALSIIGGKYELINTKITDIIPQIHFEKVFQTAIETEYNIVKFNSNNLSLKVVPINISGKITNAVVIINSFSTKERTQYNLRAQLFGKAHKAKYSFNNIISNDKAFIELKNLANCQAKSEASVLITGESGTGKEMFAQSIHNASNRSKHPFVAINCAALPQNLLESELFGYEEGAFTGAKKGGKPGYFEIANNGTIFLDEIGEMELNFQAKLLRVLDEREFTPIGGSTVIPVNIRIISATNKDLWELIEQGKFRKDLFFRLNVIPIALPPLRDRNEDVLLLFNHLKQELKSQFSLSLEAEKIITDYKWPGNARELKNCVEYLDSLNKNFIEAKDLYNVLQRRLKKSTVTIEVDKEISNFLSSIKHEKEYYTFILECLYKSYESKQRIGRRSILKLSQDKNLFLTEAQIRRMLTILELYNFVILSNGRGGTTITSLGIKAFKALTQDFN